MAQIEVIRDSRIEHAKIIHAVNELHNEGFQDGLESVTEAQHTKVFGIALPLLALNGVAVDWLDVLEFALDDTAHIPSCTFRVRDRKSIFKNYSHLGNDNMLQVQIIPPFEDTYKKINLNFHITEIRITGEEVYGEAIYKLKPFTEARFKAFGQLSTYELMDKISVDTGLGYASNVRAVEDKRYMQCSYESYKDILSREMEKSGSNDKQVYDWWVDCWDNLILCDLYDRVNSEDSEDDMKIWSTGDINAVTTTAKSSVEKVTAVFSNHPGLEHRDIYALDYDVDNHPVTTTRGNSFTVSVYEEKKKDYMEHYITDGDIQKDEFTKFEYLGEVYGDYNYFLAEKCRKIFLSKIKSEVIMVHLPHPQLGVMRGDQCRFVWYDNDWDQFMHKKRYEDGGAIATESELAAQIGWLKDWMIDNPTNDLPMQINLQYSGQYTSIGQYIRYDGETQTWDCWLHLIRPASKRPKISQIEFE